MSFDEEQQRKSRVVVETPNARREVVHHETRRIPEERQGFSTGAVALVAIAAVAITALLFFFLTRSDEPANTNVRVTASQPTPIVVQTPLTPPPATITQPPPLIQPMPPATTTTTTQPPVVITQPAPNTTTQPPSTATNPPSQNQTDDLALEDRIRQRITEDSQLATITVRVSQGRVRLEGSVPTQDLKRRAEQLARAGGGRSIENRITVTEGMSPNAPPAAPPQQ